MEAEGGHSRFDLFRLDFEILGNISIPDSNCNGLFSVHCLRLVAPSSIGHDVLPKFNGQFQLRIRLPDGTRIERTEKNTGHA
jgi:hypothetical protein